MGRPGRLFHGARPDGNGDGLKAVYKCHNWTSLSELVESRRWDIEGGPRRDRGIPTL